MKRRQSSLSHAVIVVFTWRSSFLEQFVMEEAKEVVKIAIENRETALALASLEIDTLPPGILTKALCHITVLNLDYNNLCYLPPDISLLSVLKVLSATGNRLQELPDTLQGLEKLESLHLNENCLKELPVFLSKIPMLKILDLVGNGIEIWNRELGSMLMELRLDENKLKNLPKSLSCMKNLKILELGDNSIKTLPEDIGNIEQLEVLNLSHNELCKLPLSFGNLSKLKSVDLSRNGIEDLPDSFHSAEVIENLFIDKNSLKSLPSWFGNLCSIVNLGLCDNQLLGSPLPECFGTVSGKTLKKLDLSANSITQLPQTIGELGKLEKLLLGSTIDELERRAFQNGNWLCTLPSNFGWMTCLQKLHLDENRLVELPENFGLLQSLEWLDLGQNHIQTLPESFCSLKKLWFLQVSQNFLKALPGNFGNLTSLVELRLNNNNLTELPSSFANLKNLQTLDLFHNKLSKIPKELLNLTKLLRLDLDKNNFKLKASRVPKLTKQVKYPERDPSLKDNWRGKMREDYIKPDQVKTVDILKEVDEESDEDEPYEEAGYSETVLELAMKRSLSIWKAHDGPDEREAIDRQRNKEVTSDDSSMLNHDSSPKHPDKSVVELSKSLYNEMFEDAEVTTVNKIQADLHDIVDSSRPKEWIDTCVANTNLQNEDDTEDWDKEMQNAQAYDLVLDMFRRSEQTVCFPNQLHNLICSYPPASQAFTKTANYESAVYCSHVLINSATPQLSFSSDTGQFEDADEDYH